MRYTIYKRIWMAGGYTMDDSGFLINFAIDYEH